MIILRLIFRNAKTIFWLWTVFSLFLFLSPAQWFSKPDSVPLIPHFDKLIHYTSFFIHCLLFALLFKPKNLVVKSNIKQLRILAFGIIYAMFTEALQACLPLQRSAQWGDFIADSLGSLTAFLLIIAFRKKIYELLESC